MNTASGIDLARLRRAVHLDADRTADGRYRVWGGAQMHLVNLRRGLCDCTDFELRRGQPCKHLLRSLLAEGDPDVLLALRDLIPAGGV